MDISILPKFLQVELTYKCNSRCSFCYNPNHKDLKKEISIEQILSEINRFRIRHVQLIGGEVTTIKNLSEFLDVLYKIKWRSIVTNGRIYRSDIKGKINEIYISLHGDKLTHEELTTEYGSYETIIENIERYVSWGIDVNSDTVLTRHNADYIFDIAKRAKSIGMRRLFLNIFQPEGIGSNRPDFSPSLDQIRFAITQLIRARDVLDFEVYFGTSTPFCLDKRLIAEKLAFRCGAGEWFGSVSPSGEFRICNHSIKSYGNIIELPLNKIWHSKSIDSEYRNNKLENTICDGCAMCRQCLGGCRINENGDYRLDPIVERDYKLLLSKEEMNRLSKESVLDKFPLSYR